MQLGAHNGAENFIEFRTVQAAEPKYVRMMRTTDLGQNTNTYTTRTQCAHSCRHCGGIVAKRWNALCSPALAGKAGLEKWCGVDDYAYTHTLTHTRLHLGVHMEICCGNTIFAYYEISTRSAESMRAYDGIYHRTSLPNQSGMNTLRKPNTKIHRSYA